MSIDIQKAKAQYEAHFGFAADIVARAPGRVNIIGEHTDYNHGFVLPMAIERETVILAKKREDNILNAFAANMDSTTQASLVNLVRDEKNSWIDYIVGVANELTKMGNAPKYGADLMIIGDVPLASGLSSSAALEMAALCLFEAMNDFQLEGPEGALLGQRVENEFLGLSSGIMDQFISRCGKEGHALFLDCRSLDYDLVPVAFPDSLFVIANTRCARGLTSSKYNERVAECTEAVGELQKMARNGGNENPGTHLRDFSSEELEACKGALPDHVYRRARHVLTEDERTQIACDAMRSGDLEKLGEVMTASDVSLCKDYEVTSEELDAMTEIARSLPGCYGARMTGAGFGGCTINLVAADQAEAFSAALMAQYKERTGLDGEIILSKPAAGAHVSS
jgi:galactokinase